MNRKDFLQKGILGTSIFVASSALGNIIENDIDEISPLNPIGFNHLPNPNSNIMNNAVLHKASTRGHANHGWLNTHHTFSFANYYNPERMHFGVLRVLNDDIITGGSGFPTHPHDNMEIISIPIYGALEHKDSMGNSSVIYDNEIQVMSAGSGIQHSEFNHYKDKTTNFLQIWMFPNAKNVKPRYDQIKLNASDRKNKLQQVLSPNANDAGVWVHQNAWFYLGDFDKAKNSTYSLKSKTNGLYVFVIKGSVKINNQELSERDGYGIWNVSEITLEATSNASVLLMDVPMSI